MNFKSACVVAALAVVACMASVSGEAASPVIRGRFSYDGIANCQQPPIQNFRFHAEGAVARLVGIKGGVVSGVFNLESSGVEAPDWRPRHDKQYHEA